MKYILDSSALLCVFREEPGFEIMRNLMGNRENQFALHPVNWVEVRYLQIRGRFTLQAKSLDAFATAFQIEIVKELDPIYLERAAQVKAAYAPIALGDVFAVALAQHLNVPLVTTDRGEMQKIADAGECDIVFLR
jgi:predicted nucleic acid-binding protein